ncbi:zincin [Coemansia reversa NRRL 1564]|uniref:Zincin n=1 Tax=Coemansia reversa (strain ATCC 12441 / NRRL 1564) TaxID=763665 RepID=A0A2G5BDI1_COERN|nr:zincin [Coemansia reversa NRRL 1564]|eukprot:PIA17063.1 zincin [Coemansia reversa NRRL 1564]
MATTTPRSHAKGSVLNFNLSPTEINDIVERLISDGEKLQNTVAAQVSPTFDNVIVPLATRENEKGAENLVTMFLQNFSTDEAVRDASMAAEEKLNVCRILLFQIKSLMREDVYKVVRAVYENPDEMSKLGPEDRRLELSTRFNRSINKNDGHEAFTREELDGLPEDYFDGRETKDVGDVTKYIVTTKYPDYLPAMKLAKSESTRRRLFYADETRCPENILLLQEAVQLRLEAAQLLKYKTHAEFIFVRNMAKNPDVVLEFEQDLRTRLNVLADQEISEIEALKKADKEAAGEPYDELFSWDFDYYVNMVKERKHNINDEEVKLYFPMEEVTRGVLDIYQEIFSLRFIRVENPPVWHPDVEMYEAWEAEEDKFVGNFYLDLYPRAGKFNHAAVWPIRHAFTREDGSHEYPVAAMVANFPKPTPSAPALLNHSDVVTLLHELGHVLHDICPITKWGRFHGTNTERDFVEAPSQMLENWGWEPEVLGRFAVHYKTGEPIPETLVKKLVATKNSCAGLLNLYQVFFGMYDISIHNTTDGQTDVKETYLRQSENIVSFKNGDADTWGCATFGHMMSGYDARYYGYLYSLVFSADIFESRFKKEGVFNPRTGMDYCNMILFPGGSHDSMVGLEKFLGRKPNNKAFLRSIGLATD